MIFNLSKTIFKKNQFVTSHFKIYNMLLAIDIGNTRIKAAVFEGNTLLDAEVFKNEDLQKKIENILDLHPNIMNLVVASVGNVAKESFLAFEKRINCHFIDYKTPFPFRNLYKTPHTLGIDRLVLAAGSVFQFPNQNRLIIDAGTCVTYDFVNSDDEYLGGGISPGIRLRYEALHQYTANLPLLTIDDLDADKNSILKPDLIGNSTQNAIHSGVVNGTVNEIDGFINQYKAIYPKFIIILTGGDAEFLAKRLKNTIFANSNFLLESLNQTYQYKIKND